MVLEGISRGVQPLHQAVELVSCLLPFSVCASFPGGGVLASNYIGILIAGLALGSMSPLMLVLIQWIPTMSPWWYYGFHASTGLVNWLAIAISALSDVLPPKFRAPGIGLLLAGFMLGFSLSPIFALLLAPFWLSVVSLSIVLLGLLSTILFVPETLPPSVAHFTKEQRRLETIREQELLSLSLEEQDRLVSSTSSYWATSAYSWRWYCYCRRWYSVYGRPIARFVSRPIREMAILNRNTFFRLISTLAFFSGMVSAGDQVLLVYYLQERLAFTTKDVSLLFFIMGTLGLFVQGVLLKPINDCFGEKWVVALAFAVGAIDNTMYGLARNKTTIYIAVALSTLTGMAFPTISAIKANNVAVNEQGRIQGALYSLQALASGIGPVLMRFVYAQCREDSRLGPGTMFVFAACLYLVAVGVACALPSDQANARRGGGEESDDGYSTGHGIATPDAQDDGLMDFDELVSSSSSSSSSSSERSDRGSRRRDGNGDAGRYGSLI